MHNNLTQQKTYIFIAVKILTLIFNIWKAQASNLSTKTGDRDSNLWWMSSVNTGEMLKQYFISQNK